MKVILPAMCLVECTLPDEDIADVVRSIDAQTTVDWSRFLSPDVMDSRIQIESVGDFDLCTFSGYINDALFEIHEAAMLDAGDVEDEYLSEHDPDEQEEQEDE